MIRPNKSCSYSTVYFVSGMTDYFSKLFVRIVTIDKIAILREPYATREYFSTIQAA